MLRSESDLVDEGCCRCLINVRPDALLSSVLPTRLEQSDSTSPPHTLNKFNRSVPVAKRTPAGLRIGSCQKPCRPQSQALFRAGGSCAQSSIVGIGRTCHIAAAHCAKLQNPAPGSARPLRADLVPGGDYNIHSTVDRLGPGPTAVQTAARQMETAVYRAYSSSSDEEAHPVTKMLEQQAGQRKRDRSRTPKQQPAKRARQEKAAERQVVVLDGSEEEEAADQAAVPRSPEALVPVGVTVLDEGAAAVDPSLQRRAPRSVGARKFSSCLQQCGSAQYWLEWHGGGKVQPYSAELVRHMLHGPRDQTDKLLAGLPVLEQKLAFLLTELSHVLWTSMCNTYQSKRAAAVPPVHICPPSVATSVLHQVLRRRLHGDSCQDLPPLWGAWTPGTRLHSHHPAGLSPVRGLRTQQARLPQ